MFGICLLPSAESQAKGEYVAQGVSAIAQHFEKILNSKPDHKPELNEAVHDYF